MEHILPYYVLPALVILYLILIYKWNKQTHAREVAALTKILKDPAVNYKEKERLVALLDDSPFLYQALIANGSLDRYGNPRD